MALVILNMLIFLHFLFFESLKLNLTAMFYIVRWWNSNIHPKNFKFWATYAFRRRKYGRTICVKSYRIPPGTRTFQNFCTYQNQYENSKIKFLLTKIWNLPCDIKIKHWKKSRGKVRVIRFTTGKKCCAFSSRWLDIEGRAPRTNLSIVFSSSEHCFKNTNLKLLDLTNYFLFFHHLQAQVI